MSLVCNADFPGNRLLSLPGSVKAVRRFTFDTTGCELTYQAGDALGVLAPGRCGAYIKQLVTDKRYVRDVY
ncbi:MAG: hypothetical protein ACRDR6_08155 [Pseudonocardiaceae bacterium]